MKIEGSPEEVARLFLELQKQQCTDITISGDDAAIPIDEMSRVSTICCDVNRAHENH